VKALTLVKVLEYQINFVSSKKVLIVTSLEVVGQESRQQGAPVSFEDGSPVPAENAPSASGPTSLGPRPSGPVVAAGGGGGGGGGGGPQCVPVAHLNPYVNRWTIKVRVTGKSDIKTWNNDRGNGSLFKIDLLDETGGEIGAAFFKEAVGKFYDAIQVGSVYFMSGGRVKMADKRYSGGKDYEINFDDKASITPAHDDRTIKSIHYALTPIRDLEGMEKDKVVDVMGVVKAFDPEAVDFTAKSGKQMTKRELHIMDDSGRGVDVTLWGEMGRSLVLSVGSILGVKAGKVSSSDFKTLSLNASWDTKLEVDPLDNPTAASLKAWFEADPEGRMGASVTLSERNAGGGMQGGNADAIGPLTDLFKVGGRTHRLPPLFFFPLFFSPSLSLPTI
jgi:replication factor A1